MRRRWTVTLIAVLVAACASPGATVGPATQPPPTSAPSSSPALAATTATTPAPSPSPPPSSVTSPIVGTWTRTIDCEEALAAFHAADLDDQIQAWVVANFVGENTTAAPAHECDDARPPEEHSHFFTAGGEFGSLDAAGKQVDDGAYVFVDADTISFDGSGFEYDGEIPVDFSIDADGVTFEVTVPDPCAGACRVAFGWALSAFASPTPWIRTD